jgi:hypothetical protein
MSSLIVDIITVIKSRKLWCVDHAALMEEMRNEYNISVGKSERKITACETWVQVGVKY